MNQADKAVRFRALHEAPGAFVIGNAWDAGSARVLAGAGLLALATSSGAAAGVLGRRDGAVSRDEAMAGAAAVAGACDLPVSGDLENGYGHDAQAVTETIRALYKPDWWAARSRTTAARPHSRCTRWPRRCSASRPRCRRPARCRGRSR
jgi:2-methylisocitrate lyase-like PEP mutase family enzyme